MATPVPTRQRSGFRTTESPDQGQGFYFYRHDRLLQAGGWNGVVHPERSLQLARIAVDVDDRLESHLTMNPEKTRIQASAAFIHAVESARSGTFDLRTLTARTPFGDSRRHEGQRERAVESFHPVAVSLRRSDDRLARSCSSWRDSSRSTSGGRTSKCDAFLEIDLEERTIRLNRQYRLAVTGDRGTSLNDAPLLKAALYLLLQRFVQWRISWERRRRTM